MKIRLSARTTLLIALLLPTGCSDQRDERLARFAQQSVQTQARQNEQMAEQGRQIAEASRALVEADARARQELVKADAQARRELAAAHAKLQQGLQEERGGLNRQRADLDQERRELAQQRRADPIIAEAIIAVGVLLASLAPLALAAYVLFLMHRPGHEEEAINELLVTEFVSDQPVLLPPLPRPPALLDHQSPPSLSVSGEPDDPNAE